MRSKEDMTETERKQVLADLRSEANVHVESGDLALSGQARRNILLVDLVEDLYEEIDKLKAKTVPSVLKKLIGQ